MQAEFVSEAERLVRYRTADRSFGRKSDQRAHWLARLSPQNWNQDAGILDANDFHIRT